MEMTESTPRWLAAKYCHRLAPALAISLAASLSACAPSPYASSHVSAPLASLAAPPAALPPPEMVSAGPEMFGTASWYRPGPGLHRTCTGESFTRNEMTAASPSLPMGTQVRVALLNHSKSIVVRVNDCMPHGHRILDLSEAAAERLGLMDMGVARVTVTPVMLVDNQ
jgi:rare lipoprotein A